MSRWFSFLIFSLFFFCSGLKGQGSLLISAGTEINTPEYFHNYHQYSLGIEMQKVLFKRLYWGTGLRLKADRLEFLPSIDGPGLGVVFWDPPMLSDPKDVFENRALAHFHSSLSAVQGELPIYFAYRLGKTREVPCLLQLGAQHRIAKTSIGSFSPEPTEALLYTLIGTVSLQIPIYEGDEVGFSLSLNYGIGQHFDSLTPFIQPFDSSRIRHCYGLSIQTHIYGWR